MNRADIERAADTLAANNRPKPPHDADCWVSRMDALYARAAAHLKARPDETDARHLSEWLDEACAIGMKAARKKRTCGGCYPPIVGGG